jgi:CBS domain-containing protein
MSNKQRGGVPMRAMDVMTSEVITVDEDASVQTVAKLLAERGISAVPVSTRRTG